MPAYGRSLSVCPVMENFLSGLMKGALSIIGIAILA
jgi:hypothetical protein